MDPDGPDIADHDVDAFKHRRSDVILYNDHNTYPKSPTRADSFLTTTYLSPLQPLPVNDDGSSSKEQSMPYVCVVLLTNIYFSDLECQRPRWLGHCTREGHGWKCDRGR
jgi:hypothetical protein